MIEIPFDIIEIEPESFHCIVTGECSQIPIRFILDTGASRSVMERQLGEQFFKGPDRPTVQNSHSINAEILEYGTVQVAEIKFGEHTLKDLSFTLIDLEYINSIYIQHAGHCIEGLLGGDFFVLHKAIIDYNRMMLILTK